MLNAFSSTTNFHPFLGILYIVTLHSTNIEWLSYFSLFRAVKSFHLRLKLNNWSIYKFLPLKFYLGKVSVKDLLKWDKLRKEVGFRCWQHIHPPLRRTYKWEAFLFIDIINLFLNKKMNHNDSSYVQKSSTPENVVTISISSICL